MGHKGSGSDSSSSGSDDEYKRQKKHMTKEQKAAYKLEKKRQKELGAGDKHARAQHSVEQAAEMGRWGGARSGGGGPTPADFSPGHGFPSYPTQQGPPQGAPQGEAASFFAGAGGDQGAPPPPHGFAPQPPHGFASPPPPFPSTPAFPSPASPGSREFPQPHRAGSGGPPPAQPTHAAGFPQQTPPPSGYRIPLSAGQPFPASAQAGPPPFRDLDGSPVFVGSALFENPSSVHPCKIGPGLSPPARVPYGGTETEHHGRYDLLPFVPEQMEWVPTRGGIIPPGRRPIEGGYESSGGRLFHGYAQIQGLGVPGKVGEHLGGINVAFGGQEIALQDNYWILCWR